MIEASATNYSICRCDANKICSAHLATNIETSNIYLRPKIFARFRFGAERRTKSASRCPRRMRDQKIKIK